MPPTWAAWSLNPWTSREVPFFFSSLGGPEQNDHTEVFLGIQGLLIQEAGCTPSPPPPPAPDLTEDGKAVFTKRMHPMQGPDPEGGR